MTSIDKRTVSLPAEHAAYIDRLVSEGAYASASEVVRAGLRALQERDAVMEKWLQEDVAATFDAMKADGSRAVPADAIFAELRARHAARLRDGR